MTTAQEVFDAALALMDETGRTGAIDEYRPRTLAILNSLRGELYPYSGNRRSGRGACPRITDFETRIGLDDFICQSVLPYGLAAHLLLEEDPRAAGFFQQRYEELLKRPGGRAAKSHNIERLYGGIEYGEFSRW